MGNHLTLDRKVVIKVLQEKLLLDKNAVERFQQEANIVSQLEHPNIVRVFGYGIAGRSPYLVLEFLDGKSLAQLLQEQKRLSMESALPLIKQILDALSYAHNKGVIHRDIRPSNIILLNNNEQIKFVDFAFSKILPEGTKELQTLTSSGEILGNPVYASPEFCRGQPLDARSDIYSAACLIYQILDGEPPLLGANAAETAEKHLYAAPRESQFINKDTAEALNKALAKDPLDRPPNAEQFLSLLLNQTHKGESRDRRKFALLLTAVAFTGMLGLAAVTLINSHSKKLVRPATNSAGNKRADALLKDINSYRTKSDSFSRKRLCRKLRDLAYLNEQIDKWDQAEPLFQEALKTALLIGDEDEIESCICDLSRYYSIKQLWSKAEKLHKDLLNMRLRRPAETREPLYLASSYEDLSIDAMEQGDLELAYKYGKKALSIAYSGERGP